MIRSVLVTGGLGYLGGRIVTHLVDLGLRVRLTTRRRPDQCPTWARMAEVVSLDLDDRDRLAEACHGMDAVIHLAALNAQASAADTDLAQRVNVEGSRNLVTAAEQSSVKRLLYMSTAHVYAAPLTGRLDETTPTLNPHPYATSHQQAEDFFLRSATSGVVFRLSNGFGAPADPQADCWMLLLNDLCRQAVEKRELTLRGDGLDQRDFIPLSDVTEAVFHMLNRPESGIFNLGSGQPRTTLEMAKKVAGRCRAILGFLPPVVRREPAPDRQSDLLDFRIDRLLATGFMPHNEIDAEIDATLRLCRETFAP